MNGFLPEGYNVPEVDGGYMKLKEGENQFRIMSPAILGWELWINKKPKRYKEDQDVPLEDQESADVDENTGEPRMAKHFMAFAVWNRNAQPKPKLQILELTQKGIKKAINALNRSKSWGNPTGTDGYDILVNKEGEGLNTEYTVNPAPKEKLSKDIIETFKKMYLNLDALYEGNDPFKNDVVKTAEEVFEVPDKL
jgi:hypothetical protein